MTTQIHRISDLKRDLRSIKDAANESAAGSPPAGYDDLEGDALKVADECYRNGLDAMETAILNWIYDQENAQDQPATPPTEQATAGEHVPQDLRDVLIQAMRDCAIHSLYQHKIDHILKAIAPFCRAPAPAVAQGETPRTDAVRWFQESTVHNGVTEAVPAATARRLERELNEAKAERDQARQDLEERCAENDRERAAHLQAYQAVTRERDEARAKLGGAVMFGAVGGRLMTRIFEAADMSLENATDVELQLVRLLSELAELRKDRPVDVKGRGLPEDVREFIERITLWLQKSDDAGRTDNFHWAYKLYDKYDVEGWHASRRAAIDAARNQQEGRG